MTVDFNGTFYEVNLEDGTFYSFDKDEADLDLIDRTIEAWTAWKSYVLRTGISADD